MAEVVGDKRSEFSLHRGYRTSEESPDRRARSRGALPMPAGRPLGMLERQGHRACAISVSTAPSSLSRQPVGREGQGLVQRRWLLKLVEIERLQALLTCQDGGGGGN